MNDQTKVGNGRSQPGAWSFYRVKNKIIFPLLKHIPLWIVVLTTVFPIYFALTTSLKTNLEYSINKTLPSASPTLENYTQILMQPNFYVWVRNSAVLMLSVAILSIVIGALAAFAFSQMKFAGQNVLLQVLLSLLVFPTIVLAIPLFVIFAQLHMINALPAVIIIYLGVTAPFTLFILTGFFRTMPNEILDAARIDGSSKMQLIRHILLPLTMPALITVAIVNANFVWNELLIAVIFLQGQEVKTLMSGISAFGRFGVLDVPRVMASLVLASLPMIIIYIVGQKSFIKGMTAGALHG